jgi:hypothetical protein
MCVNGGLLLLICFVVILVKAFNALGRGMQPLRKAGEPIEYALWCVGASLMAHCVTFLSISYFDQSSVVLALVLGMVPGLCVASHALKGEEFIPSVDAQLVSSDERVSRGELRFSKVT